MASFRRIGENLFDKLVPDKYKPQIIHQVRYYYVKLQKFFLHGFRDLPIAFNIETNDICTRSCSYCPKPKTQNIYLKDEVFYSIIDQLKNWGFRGRISPMSFNEPLTDKRIYKFLEYAHLNLPKCELILYTNGDLLNKQNVKKLIKVNVSEIITSLHDPISAKKVSQLKTLAKEFSLVNLKDMRAAYRKTPLNNRGGSLKKLAKVIHPPHCYKIDVMVIRADGNVVLCCQDIQKKYIQGNVYQKKIKDIWENPRFSKIRKEVSQGIYSLPICKTCGYEY